MNKILFTLLFAILYSISFSQNFQGKIIRVIDGDDVNFQSVDSIFSVHLYGITAPEVGQYFYSQSIDQLEKYLWNEASIQIIKTKNIPGINAILFIKGININIDQVKNGYAFYDRPRTTDPALAQAEEQAKKKKLGIWRSRSILAPWEYEEGKLPKPPPADGNIKVLICVAGNGPHFHKKYCTELQSCRGNVIVISRKQAKSIHLKPCKYCF